MHAVDGDVCARWLCLDSDQRRAPPGGIQAGPKRAAGRRVWVFLDEPAEELCHRDAHPRALVGEARVEEQRRWRLEVTIDKDPMRLGKTLCGLGEPPLVERGLRRRHQSASFRPEFSGTVRRDEQRNDGERGHRLLNREAQCPG